MTEKRCGWKSPKQGPWSGVWFGEKLGENIAGYEDNTCFYVTCNYKSAGRVCYKDKNFTELHRLIFIVRLFSNQLFYPWNLEFHEIPWCIIWKRRAGQSISNSLAPYMYVYICTFYVHDARTFIHFCTSFELFAKNEEIKSARVLTETC